MAASVLAMLVLINNVDSASAQTRASAPPAPKDDTQSWNDVQITIPISKRVDFLLLGTLRFGRNLTHPVDERIGFNFSYKLDFIHLRNKASERYIRKSVIHRLAA